MTGYNMPPGVSPRNIPGCNEDDSYPPVAEEVNNRLLRLAGRANNFEIRPDEVEELAYELAEAVAKLERDFEVQATLHEHPFMCQDGHVQIWYDVQNEYDEKCPLCRALADVESAMNDDRGIL